MMKRLKRISVNNPHLKKIRDNLRAVIIKACANELKNLMVSNWEEYQKLSMALKYSIVNCSNCSATDRDMIYSPRFNRWFCFLCYDKSNVAMLEKMDEKDLIRLE